MAPTASLRPPPNAGSSRCFVLLAEDDPANAMVSGALLEMLGYDYHHVADGLDLLARAKTGFYHVLIVDMRLTRMDGIEATRLIREFEAKTGHRRLEILCVTANAMAGERERCLAAGMDDYLSKPFDVNALRQKLAVLAEKSVAARHV